MPFVKRGREQTETIKPAKRRKKEYDVLENIGYKEDEYHSMFRELPDNIDQAILLIGRYVVSFLNGKGGILAFGVRSSGVIYGERITRKEEDTLKCAVDEAIKRINPCVCNDKYRVNFTPVKGKHFEDHFSNKEHNSRQVLEIKVAPGDPNELYEDMKHEAYSRNSYRLKGPLTPHQIKDITITKLKQRIRTEKSLADFLSPARSLARTNRLSSAVAAKMPAGGEGHKVVAERAVAPKTRISVKKPSTSTETSSLASVMLEREKNTSGSAASVIQTRSKTQADSKNTKDLKAKDSFGSEKRKAVAKDSKKNSIKQGSDKNLSQLAEAKDNVKEKITGKDATSSTSAAVAHKQTNTSVSGSEAQKYAGSGGNKDQTGLTKETEAIKDGGMKGEISTEGGRKTAKENNSSKERAEGSKSGQKDFGSKNLEKAKQGKDVDSSGCSSRSSKKTPPPQENKENAKSSVTLPTGTKKIVADKSGTSVAQTGKSKLSSSNFVNSSNQRRQVIVPPPKTTTLPPSSSYIRRHVIKLPPPPPPPPSSYSYPALRSLHPSNTFPCPQNYHVPDYPNIPSRAGVYWDPQYRCFRHV